MYDDTKDYQLGYWNDDYCEKNLLGVCKGPALATNPKPAPQHCGIEGFEDFIPYRDDCYWQSSNKTATWKDAEQACVEKGGHLTSIRDWSEQYFIYSQLANEPIWIGLDGLEVTKLFHVICVIASV